MTKRKKWIAAMVLILLGLSVYFVSRCSVRIVQMEGTASYYDGWELAILAFPGSIRDRAEAQAVLNQAEAAFEDLSHTREENQESYGPLARYATTADRDAVSETHSLELWSAHLGDDRGYLWIYYSNEAFDEKGDRVHGSWRIPSLWTVEKDSSGVWAVTAIKEHP